MFRVLVLVTFSGAAAAQSIQLDFGIRGGLLANPSFQENRLCSGAGCFLATYSFSAETNPGTIGPTVSLLIHDQVEVRGEAVHRRFAYETRSDVVNSAVEQHSVTSTRGHIWEFPFLGTYRFPVRGRIRPFAGGGITFGTNVSSDIEYQSTSTRLVPPPPSTTTFMSRKTVNSGGPFATYVVGGLDGRTSYLSIRPELRYAHFYSDSSSDVTAILKPNQFEFVLGISVHPFRFKK
jgi:hypothetical protein